MPVAWEARKTLSSATSWSSEATDQSPKRRMMSLVPLTRSNFVMRANLIARSVRPSRSSPVSPRPVLKAAMTVAVLPMSSRTRPATRPKLALEVVERLAGGAGADADGVDRGLVVVGELERPDAEPAERGPDGGADVRRATGGP